VNVTDSQVTNEEEIHHTPLGCPGDHAPREVIGLYIYLASMAAFLTWLLVYGVNV
jgi:hypothetical protein